MEAIFDFNKYEYMVIESDDGKVIAEIRQDSIDVKGGYRVRMMPKEKGTEENEAIPIEWIWKYWDDGDKPKNYALHIRDMINEWKEEQAEKCVVLHPCDINFVSEEAEKEYYESLGFESED